MSNKSGTSGQIISLPKGGGALHGIGETFSPDLHTGTGNFTVPIALPPGRNGFQPQLNLIYSTGNGNGPFGLGWGLGIPGVSRKTSKGVPRYDDMRDTYILSGTEDLVPVQRVGETTCYRPRTEGLFARIERHLDTANDYWEVRSKDGLVSRYGMPEARGQETATIADPTNRIKVFAWKLTETRDPFGNRIVYTYRRDTGHNPSHHWDQLYLERIQYVDYTDENGQEQFLVSVEFEYGDLPDRYDDGTPAIRRVYPFSDYRAGFEIRTRKRCKRIITRTHADKVRLVRAYEFMYLDERVLAGELADIVLPRNGVALLSQIVVIGYDDAGQPHRELPPLEFGYTCFEPERQRDLFAITGAQAPLASLARPEFELADLTGDGLPDILEMNGTVRYWRNLGGGCFDLPRPMREAPAGLSLADTGVQMIDADGDGRIDLLVTQNGLSGYFPLRYDGQWDRRSFRRYQQAPSFNLEDPEVKLVDLDGDGVTDAIRSGTRLECFFNRPQQDGWNGTRWVERQALEVFPNVNFSDPRVKWGDMTGDGLQDIVLVSNCSIEYWPSLGHGNWGKRIHMQDSPHFPYGYDPKRILVGDVDGDGLADIVYVDDRYVTLWLNQSGNGWSEPIEIQGTPPITDMDAVRLVDLLGSGVSGILWSADANGQSRATMFFLDLTGAMKPYLLAEMDNHMGAVTKIEYASSNRFYLDDQQDPKTRWRSSLPFPVQVVARVEVIDALSQGKLTTAYRYHHGYWDGAEREFRGFGMVEQFDSETFDVYNRPGLHGDDSEFTRVEGEDDQRFSPPIVTKTWFHQGPVGPEYGDWQEDVDRSGEFWQGDRPLLNHKEYIDPFLRGLARNEPRQRRIRRDALRALRGSVLRTELYALDGTEREGRPYTVTESQYSLREEVNPDPGLEDRLRIFFPHLVAQRTTQWERGDDPMIHFAFTGDYDDYGQPTVQTAIALPRRKDRRQPVTGAVVGKIDGDTVNQTRILATHTRTQYAVPDDDLYIHDRVAQVRTFELDQPPTLTETNPSDLAQVLRDQALAAWNVHQTFQQLLMEWLPPHELPADLRLMGHTLHHYDGDPFKGRNVGQVGPYGALTCSESLVFTTRELDAAYDARRPLYLRGGAALPPGAPAGFGDDLGYRWQESSSESYHEGYYADTQRRQHDFQATSPTQRRGVVVAMQDALSHQTTIVPDRFWLLPEHVRDPHGLETAAEYDYRVLQPAQVTDPNGNAVCLRYTPLGLLYKQFLVGRGGEGGTEKKPEIEYTYDLLAYQRTRHLPEPQPISIHTRQRICHANDANTCDDVIEAREYSDGFGRLIQKRAQAEELVFGETGGDIGLLLGGEPVSGQTGGAAHGLRVADRVVVSGWQVYDNKGHVVEKYEPFLGHGWEFQPEHDAKREQHVTLFYDPRGQVTRTLNPDGSEQRVILGIPHDLSNPAEFSPTPWESYNYDANDLAPLSRDAETNAPLTNRAPARHHYTPPSTLLDALGRVICAIERNGSDPTQEWYITRSSYDIRGNLVEVKDALGRSGFKHAYDLLNRPLRMHSIDAGLRTSVLDAQGNLLEYRDSKRSFVLREYDELNRLISLWAIDDGNATQRFTQREKVVYGDRANLTDATARNVLGKPYIHYDEAGKLTFDRYDFKGNLTEKSRQVIGNPEIANGWIAHWEDESTAELELEQQVYQTSRAFDALNRPTKITYPKDVSGHPVILEPTYNHAGALASVKLDTDTYVEHIAYNAKGQRVLIAYGNKVMTRYAYDPRTFRLVRLRTETFSKPDDLTWQSAPKPASRDWLFQDFTYVYDLAGNVTAIQDRTPESGLRPTPDQLNRAFEYDPIYRLVSATGREYAAPQPQPPQHIWEDVIHPPNLTTTALYTQTYGYDPAGNLNELHHTAASSVNSYTKRLDLAPNQNGDGSNRLSFVKIGSNTTTSTPYAYEHDDNGNITQETLSRFYFWDHANRLVGFKTQNGAGASVEARYLYDADGMRVKKWMRTNGTGDGETTVYIDGVFEHHRWKETGQPGVKQNNYLHVMDNQSRMALVRIGDKHSKDSGPDVQYHLGDHLGSSNVVVGIDNALINREEFYPYGQTSFGSFAKKRYRFTGKERDEESGLYYHGARYYAPWLARWLSCDPKGNVDGNNLYQYSLSNPTLWIDSTGTQVHLLSGTGGAPAGATLSGGASAGATLSGPGTTSAYGVGVGSTTTSSTLVSGVETAVSTASSPGVGVGAATVTSTLPEAAISASPTFLEYLISTAPPIAAIGAAFYFPIAMWNDKAARMRQMVKNLNEARRQKIAPGAPSQGSVVAPGANTGAGVIGDAPNKERPRLDPSGRPITYHDFPAAEIRGELRAAPKAKGVKPLAKQGSTRSYMYIISVFTEEGIAYKPGQTVDPQDRFNKYLNEYGEALYEMEIFGSVATPNARVGEGRLIGEFGARAVNVRKNPLEEMRGGRDYSDVIEVPRYNRVGTIRNPFWEW